MDFARVLGLIVSFLRGEQAECAVIGAMALYAYGRTRATEDLDFVVEAGIQSRLVAFLERQGFETLHRSSGYSNHVHPDPLLGRVDFVYVDATTATRIFGGSSASLDMAGVKVAVPRPEHLAAMKVHAMRQEPGRTLQEMADVQYLMGLPGVDRLEIRGYFEAAGLLQRYEQIQALLDASRS